MTVKDFLGIWKQSGAPYARIIDANAKKDANRPENGAGVMFGGWCTELPSFKGEWEKYEDCEVLKFYVTHEVSHKKYKELGLIPPYRRDITAEYEIGDLKQKTYYDIVIDGRTAKGEQDKREGEGNGQNAAMAV